MTTIAIITSTGNPLFDQVLKGVYGSATMDPNNPHAAIFFPAEEFRGVSHLFTQRPQMPVRADQIKKIEIEGAGNADLLKAQILFGLGAKWAGMYEARTRVDEGQLPDIGTALLTGEREAVARGVQRHLESIGMHVYEVPIVVKGQVLRHGSHVGDAAEMMRAMEPTERTIEIDPGRRPRVLVRAALSGDAGAIDVARQDARPVEQAQMPSVQAAAPVRRSFIRSFFDGPGAGAEEERHETAATSAVPREAASHETWAGFRGVDATVRAFAFVVAPNLDAIPQALRYAEQASAGEDIAMRLEPVDVAAVRDLQREDLVMGDGYADSDPDFEDSDGHDDWRERG